MVPCVGVAACDPRGQALRPRKETNTLSKRPNRVKREKN